MAVSLLAGCRQREDVDRLKAINQSLENANNIIQEDNKLVEEALKIKYSDWRTSSIGKIWQPRGYRIKKESDSLVLIIEGLKKALLKQTDSLRKEDASWFKQLNAEEGPGYKLVHRLAAFKDSIPAIICAEGHSDYPVYLTSIKRDIDELCATVPLLRGYSDSLNNIQRIQYAKNWLEDNFSETSSNITLLVLNTVKNDLLATTKVFMDFCLAQTVVHKCFKFGPLATLSSSYVKRGEPIEVTAGLVEFADAPEPRIFINDKQIKLTYDDVAIYRYKANGEPGKHNALVRIEYTMPDGTQASVSKKLNYIIADEK
jgi:hypothetical protein